MQHFHHVTSLVDQVRIASRVINRMSIIIDNLCNEVQELKVRSRPKAVAVAKVRAVELFEQLDQLNAELNKSRR